MEGSLKVTKSETALPVNEDEDDTSASPEGSRDGPSEAADSVESTVTTTRGLLDICYMKAVVYEGISGAAMQIHGVATKISVAATEAADSARKSVVDQATFVAEATKTRVCEAGATAHCIATNRKVQVTAASATGGAVVVGAGGAAAGLAAGTTVGAAVGVVPALFTFGLSIPIGAMVGGGAGLLVGTGVGGTMGAVGGGVTGYGVYSKKEEIGTAMSYVKDKVVGSAEYVQGTTAAAFGRAREAAGATKAHAFASAEYVAERAAAAKNRLVGSSGTGGTETTD